MGVVLRDNFNIDNDIGYILLPTLNLDNLKSSLKDKISQDNFGETFQKLYNAINQESSWYSTILNLQTRYNSELISLREGTISRTDYTHSIEQITKILNDTIEELKENDLQSHQLLNTILFPVKQDDLEEQNDFPFQEPESEINDFIPNELLFQKIWESIAPHVNQENKKLTQFDKIDRIITELPHPISEYLRKLIAKGRESEKQEVFYNKLNQDRLLYLLYTYKICIELIAYTLLAQLWDELLNGMINELSSFLKTKLKEFFNLTIKERKVYNIIPLIQNMGDFMKDNNIEPFIEEYNHILKILSSQTGFYEACMNLERLHSPTITNDRLPDSEAKSLCITVERNLASVMAELGFMVKYKMLSVKEVQLIKLKHEVQPRYRLNYVELKYRPSGMDMVSEETLQFIDNNSVVILNEEKGKNEYLNLSPLIFDENTYDNRAKLVSLCIFQSFEKSAKAYTFRYIYRPADRSVVKENSNLELIHKQLTRSKKFYE